MHLHIKRERFDNLPDIIVSAAMSIGAPVVQQTTGQHLTVVHMPAPQQLISLRDKLGMTLDNLRDRSEARQLMTELGRCSGMFVISTTAKLELISNNSAPQYQVVEQMYARLVPVYEEFSDGCALFIRGLSRLQEG